MKKLIALMLCLSFIFAFAACSGKSSTDGEETEGTEILTGTWELYDEGASAPKTIMVFNEDMTGTRTKTRSARTEINEFTYTDDGAKLVIYYDDNTMQELSYELTPGKLNFVNEGHIYVKAAG